MVKLTRFERTRLISARALQLSLGAPPLVKVSKDALPDDIVRAELEKGVLPLVVIRKLPNGEVLRVEA